MIGPTTLITDYKFPAEKIETYSYINFQELGFNYINREGDQPRNSFTFTYLKISFVAGLKN